MAEKCLQGKLNRRDFLRALGTAGATTVLTSVTAQAAPSIGYLGTPASLTTDPPPGMKAVYLYTIGPGGNMNWQPGDAIKFLPPEKIPAGKAADTVAALPKTKLLEIYRTMYTTRKWENALKDNWIKGEIYGSWLMYAGQEAISSGVMAALNPNDYCTSTHRPAGHIVAKGTDLKKATAELYLRKTGISKGKGHRANITDPSVGFLGSNGIVGSAWFLAAGAAYSAMVRGSKQVAVAFGGDNAANQSYYFSAVRNATLFKLPVIFVIENNFQNVFTPMAVTVPTKQISDYTKGLDIPSLTVDGNDVTAVYAAAKVAVERARSGEGPTVIEGMTYRWYDHAMFGGTKTGEEGAFKLPYRTDSEVREWMARDPLVRYKVFLLERRFVTDIDLANVEQDAQQAIVAAFDFARASPAPDPQSGLEDVYIGGQPVTATQFFTA
ncbi:MAG: thiamine pyrophosphate-dependent dehydrogenase E1 component subunit alpha [Chloroflexi bacterium]|nr:thiamine pyrophosphate-dependent dehydrogenase E1 component subunit alpha [Chloroflexota bacterium]